MKNWTTGSKPGSADRGRVRRGRRPPAGGRPRPGRGPPGWPARRTARGPGRPPVGGDEGPRPTETSAGGDRRAAAGREPPGRAPPRPAASSKHAVGLGGRGRRARTPVRPSPAAATPGDGHARLVARRAGRRRRRDQVPPARPAGPGASRTSWSRPVARASGRPGSRPRARPWSPGRATQSGAWNSASRSTSGDRAVPVGQVRRAPAGTAATIRSGRRRRPGCRPGTSGAGRPRRPAPPATRRRAHGADAGRRVSSSAGHPELGAVPGHRRVVPGHPGQPAAVRGGPGRGHEVRRRSTRGTTAQRAVDRHGHQPVVGGRARSTPLLDARPATVPTGSAARRRSGRLAAGRRRRGSGRIGGPRRSSGSPVPALVGLVDVEEDAAGHGGRAPAVLVDPAAHAHPGRRDIVGGARRARTRPPPGGRPRRAGSPTSRPTSPSACSPPRLTLPAATVGGRPRRRPPAEAGHRPESPVSLGARLAARRSWTQYGTRNEPPVHPAIRTAPVRRFPDGSAPSW